MPRNMSFRLTKKLIYERRKTVTRRLGWWFLKPGDIVMACEQVMGLKPGEKIKRICPIRIISTRAERLDKISPADVVKEGFLSREHFIFVFCNQMGCYQFAKVNRIEFEYLPK